MDSIRFLVWAITDLLRSMVPSRVITLLLPTGIEDPRGRKLASSCWILHLEVMMEWFQELLRKLSPIPDTLLLESFWVFIVMMFCFVFNQIKLTLEYVLPFSWRKGFLFGYFFILIFWNCWENQSDACNENYHFSFSSWTHCAWVRGQIITYEILYYVLSYMYLNN